MAGVRIKNARNIILPILSVFSLSAMLCGGFLMRYEAFDNYFQLYPISVGICLVVVSAFISFLLTRIRFQISIPDIAISILILYYVARYDYELQLANWKIVFAVLLLILWFAIRILLTNVVVSRIVLFGGIVAIGCWLAVWGLMQLYGYLPSNHILFAITGPFYNPGPYSGYLAMIFPIALGCLLQSGRKLRYLWLVAFSLIFCILPAGMSRSAWFALSISCLWILSIHFHWFAKVKSCFQTYHCRALLYSLLATVLIVFASVLLFRMKIDSGNGRLFMWKITCKAIAEKPLFGYGPGAFSHTYGEMQADYFASGHYTDQEERVAGAPEYAFNEYLQLCVEGGGVLLVMFLFLVVWGIYKGISGKEYVACSGLISLLIFSLSSYPFQVLPFLMLGVLLLAVCVSGSGKEKVTIGSVRPKVYTFLFLLSLLAGNVLALFRLQHMGELSERLYLVKVLQEQFLKKEAAKGYSNLYCFFKHNYGFLYGYAKALFDQKRYDEAIAVLERASLISCYPDIYNLKGQCYQAIENHAEAEKSYKRSSLLLPIRIYPYYLLAKLYAEPSYFNIVELKRMADVVLLKEPKVHSKAIDEMRAEMKTLLSNNSNINLKND